MDYRQILSQLMQERSRIDDAIAALESLSLTARRGPGRPPLLTKALPDGRHRRRHMSAASRRKISEMMKKRWAERKRKAASA